MAVEPLELHPWVLMAAGAIRREYPVALIATLQGPSELALPRELTPSFCGSFDWHSAVHGHWTLVRAARLHPTSEAASIAREALALSLTSANLEREHAFVEQRPGFERPYGLAWVLQLAAELKGWDDAQARDWARSLEPLEELAARRMLEWAEKLPYPIRSGEHSQSAFAFGLTLDWARDAERLAFAERLRVVCSRLYRSDVSAPVDYEPSGHDFLSPALGEADLMRRVLTREAYINWIYNFLPDARDEKFARWLRPVTPPDRSDGKLAHLDGLNLSRAWMLQGIVSALPEGHELYSPLERAAALHAAAGLEGAAGDDWMGTHWLASFVTYLLTERGLR